MESSSIRTLRDLAAVVKGRRLQLGLDQATLAEKAGVSRKWIVEFEAGKPTAEIGLLLNVLTALQLTVAINAFELEQVDPGDHELDRLLEDYGHGH